MRFVLTIFVLLFPLSNIISQNNIHSPILDSVIYYRDQSKDINLSLKERLELAEKASNLSSQLNIDSTTIFNNRNLSYLYVALQDYESFRKVNHQNLKLAEKLKDTFVLAVANSNLGYYYLDRLHDSAYYYYNKALKYFIELNDKTNQSSVLSNLGKIQLSEKDYVGSEESSVQALKLIQELPKTEYNLGNQWILYNRLGIISQILKQYDKSLEYHERALETSNKEHDGIYDRLTTIFNKADIYRKIGDPKRALELYQSIIDNNDLLNIDPSFYASVIENIAFAKFEAKETDYNTIESMLKEAYIISDTINDFVRKSEVSIYLTKFYKGLNKTEQALPYAQEAYRLAKMSSNNELLLESILLLSELNPGEEGKKYLNEHIRLSDSLLFNERAARNKFARIAFETDEIEKENERISRERMWLMALSGGLILTLVLLYIIITQRARNKQLKLEKEQQLANEEIYNLMLSQQDKVEEARTNEKKRISQELHDGILGRLFGTRLSLDSLNFSEGKDAVKTRSNYISELKTIEEDIRKISHDLNTDFISGSGFMDIITELIEKQTQVYQLKYEFNHNDNINWEGVSNKTKINIYRIIQECLQNIYKHAEANKVKISFKSKKSVICLSVSDDGKGFDTHKSRKGIGLKNIRSRVQELEGKVQFDSEINKGTTITIDIPYYSN